MELNCLTNLHLWEDKITGINTLINQMSVTVRGIMSSNIYDKQKELQAFMKEYKLKHKNILEDEWVQWLENINTENTRNFLEQLKRRHEDIIKFREENPNLSDDIKPLHDNVTDLYIETTKLIYNSSPHEKTFIPFRHCEAISDSDKGIAGFNDEVLTNDGISVAYERGKKLRWLTIDSFECSPLIRAAETWYTMKRSYEGASKEEVMIEIEWIRKKLKWKKVEAHSQKTKLFNEEVKVVFAKFGLIFNSALENPWKTSRYRYNKTSRKVLYNTNRELLLYIHDYFLEDNSDSKVLVTHGWNLEFMNDYLCEFTDNWLIHHNHDPETKENEHFFQFNKWMLKSGPQLLFNPHNIEEVKRSLKNIFDDFGQDSEWINEINNHNDSAIFSDKLEDFSDEIQSKVLLKMLESECTECRYFWIDFSIKNMAWIYSTPEAQSIISKFSEKDIFVLASSLLENEKTKQIESFDSEILPTLMRTIYRIAQKTSSTQISKTIEFLKRNKLWWQFEEIEINEKEKQKTRNQSNESICDKFLTRSYLRNFIEGKSLDEKINILNEKIIPIRLSENKEGTWGLMEYSDLIESWNSRILITWDGWSWKSTLLRQLVMNYNLKPENEDSLWMYMDLSEYKNKSPEDDLEKALENYSKFNWWVLVLDGFDEMSEENQNWMSRSIRFLEIIEKMNDKWIQVIVSSRFIPKNTLLALSFNLKYANVDLDENWVFDFIEQNISDIKNREQLTEVCKKKDNKNFFSLLKKPLFISMICYIINEEGFNDSMLHLNSENEYEALEILVQNIIEIYIDVVKSKSRSEKREFKNLENDVYELLYYCAENDKKWIHDERVRELVEKIWNLSALPFVNHDWSKTSRPTIIHKTLNDYILARWIKKYGNEKPENNNCNILLPGIGDLSADELCYRYCLKGEITTASILEKLCNKELDNSFCHWVTAFSTYPDHFRTLKNLWIINSKMSVDISMFPNMTGLIVKWKSITKLQWSKSLEQVMLLRTWISWTFPSSDYPRLKKLIIQSSKQITDIEWSETIEKIFANKSGLSGTIDLRRLSNLRYINLHGCKDLLKVIISKERKSMIDIDQDGDIEVQYA